MLVFRSLTIGLLGACLMLLMSRPYVALQVSELHPPPTVFPATHADTSTIIDVAPSITAAQIASLVRLEPSERIATVNDVPVAGDLGAGIQIGALDLQSRRFIDLGIDGPSASRRILVLMH